MLRVQNPVTHSKVLTDVLTNTERQVEKHNRHVYVYYNGRTDSLM